MTESTPWEATLRDMRAMAVTLDDEGWTTHSIVAGDTAPVAPEDGDDGRFGIFHVIQGDDAETLESLIENREFEGSEAYVAVSDGTEYVVTVCLDGDAQIAVLFAGAFERAAASACFAAAEAKGLIYTHAQRLDGTPVATFEHADPTLFNPSSGD